MKRMCILLALALLLGFATATRAADDDSGNEINTALTFDGSDLEVTDAGGTLGVDVSGLGTFADDLGGHVATQPLDMGGASIGSAGPISVENVGVSGSHIQLTDTDANDPSVVIDHGDGSGGIAQSWTWSVEGEGSLRLGDATADQTRLLLEPAAVSGLGEPRARIDGTLHVAGPLGVALDTPLAAVHVSSAGSELIPELMELTALVHGQGGAKLDSASSVFLLGTTAYVAASSQTAGGLDIIDVSDPASPTLLGVAAAGAEFGSLFDAYRVFVQGTRAYVINGGEETMSIIDVSDPAGPTALGVTGFIAFGTRISVVGSLAYIGGSSSFYIIDVSDPAIPLLVEADSRSCADVTMVGTTAYMANSGSKDLLIVDFSDPSSPSEIGDFDADFDPDELFLAGSLAYLTSNNGLMILDVSNPSSPTLVSRVGPGESGFTHLGSGASNITDAHDIVVSGDRAYILAPAGLTVANVADPSSPIQLTAAGSEEANFAHLDGASSIAFDGTHLFVAAYDADALAVVSLGTQTADTLIVEDDVEIHDDLRVDFGSPGVRKTLVATDTEGRLEYSRPVASATRFSEFTVDASGQTSFANFGPSVSFVGLKEGDEILLLSSFSFRISGGSGDDAADFRLIGQAAGCADVIVGPRTEPVDNFDQHRNEFALVHLQRFTALSCAGDYTFRLQVGRAGSDDVLSGQNFEITALRL